MGKYVYSSGKIVEGDYKDKHIYNWNDDSFIIVADDEDGVIQYKGLLKTNWKLIQEISKKTVDHYVDVGSSKADVSVKGVVAGLVLAGPVGGLLGAASALRTEYDVALYFRDGKKSIVRMNNVQMYEILKRKLYEL